MFTGIIEEIGVIESLSRRQPAARLKIKAARVLEGTRIGDSISVDGVCLTVTAMAAGSFSVDVQEETAQRTRFALYRAGMRVNLERALTPASRMGGHYVQGHVDATGTVRAWRQEGNDWVLRVRLPAEVARYVVEKGFIALNGISLTVAARRSGECVMHIIPHTRAATTLADLRPGERVNIEVDVIAKYVESLV